MKGKKLRDPLFWIGVAYMALLVLFAVFGPLIPIPPSPDGKVLDPVFDSLDIKGKSTIHLGPGFPGALLGTDEIGRSFLQRLAYGARISLFIGFAVQTINLIVGISVGVIATFSKKWISNAIMRFTDGMFAFPDILFAILIVGIIGATKVGPLAVIFALSISGWPSIARLTKTQLATLKEREYVVAARASGASTAYLVFKHLLPQMSGIFLAVSTVELAGTIISESTLGFLGIGVQPPTPTWGGMINSARTSFNSYPVELLWPCLILSGTVFSLNFIGDGLRNYFDPKSNQG